MQENNLSALTAIGASAPVTETPREQTLGRDEFLKLLIAQLQNQDPLSPEDPSKFVSELAQFSNLEQLIAIREGVDALTASRGRGVLDAASLIGREVLASGNQIEVDAEGRGQLAYDLPRDATQGELVFVDAAGRRVSTQVLTPSELAAGRHRLEVEVAAHGDVAPGIYRYELHVQAGGESLTPIPYIAGVATGARAASVGGDVNLLIGSIEAPIADTFEIGSAR